MIGSTEWFIGEVPLMTVFPTRKAAIDAVKEHIGTPDHIAFPFGDDAKVELQWFGESVPGIHWVLLVERLTPGRWVVIEEIPSRKSFKTLIFPLGDAS